MEDEIKYCANLLREGKVIIYPTDTIWGLGCDATNSKAIERLFEIKNRPSNKSLIVLVDSIERLNDYIVDVPKITPDLIKAAKKPLSIIFDEKKNLAKNVSSDQTICVRVVNNDFCKKLIQELGRPITSTSANISGESSPLSFAQISQTLKDRVDYVVKTGQEIITTPKPSTIIRLHNNNEFEIIRN